MWCVRVTADSSKISIQQKSSKLLLTTQKAQFSTASSGFIHSCWLLPHPVCLILTHTLQKCQQSYGHLLSLIVLTSSLDEWIISNCFTSLVFQAQSLAVLGIGSVLAQTAGLELSSHQFNLCVPFGKKFFHLLGLILSWSCFSPYLSYSWLWGWSACNGVFISLFHALPSHCN